MTSDSSQAEGWRVRRAQQQASTAREFDRLTQPQPDSFERLQAWIEDRSRRGWPVDWPVELTDEEVEQLTNLVRAIVADVFTVARGLVGRQQ